MQTYTHYKESGIDWIGQIPEHWEVSKVKNYLEIPITDGPHTTPILLDEGIPFISAESIKNGKIDFSKKRGNISEEDYKLFSQKYVPQRNDIYMIKSGATTGNIAMVETDDIFTIWSPLAVFRTGKKILPRLLYNVLSSGYFRRGVELNWSFGTQQNIGMGILSNLFITIPPIQEQEAIANFLDEKTAKIDALVQTKEQQIEKLKELRQAKIHQAVTKGLDASAPIKDSGVAWIGEIPAHWEVTDFKRILIGIKDGTHGTHQRVSNGKFLLSAKNIHNNGIRISGDESMITDKDFHEITKNGYPKKNDLLITCVGTIGRTYVYDLDYPIAFQRSVAFLRFNLLKGAPNYFKFYIESPYYQFILSQLTKTSAQGGVYMGDILKSTIILPTLPEQKQIVAYLDEVTGKIDQAIAQKQEQITKLKEYKQSLINDVVTGKVKVALREK